jgi:hypothetical protein
MPCLLGCLAIFMPRLVLALIFIFSRYLSVYKTVLWPLLGFFFMPLTTLAYAFAINSNGKLDGIYLFVYLLAVLIDLGLLGSGESSRRRWWRGRASQ